MRSGDAAWVALVAGIVTYEAAAACSRVEWLSHAVDRYRSTHPVPTYAVIVYLAGHLTRVWPRCVDPLSRIADRNDVIGGRR